MRAIRGPALTPTPRVLTRTLAHLGPMPIPKPMDDSVEVRPSSCSGFLASPQVRRHARSTHMPRRWPTGGLCWAAVGAPLPAQRALRGYVASYIWILASEAGIATGRHGACRGQARHHEVTPSKLVGPHLRLPRLHAPRPALRQRPPHPLAPRPHQPHNLAAECEHHHQGKHDSLTVTRLPDGTFRWTTPSGITADQPPRRVLTAWTYRPPPNNR
jgi:hypothetical protein